VEGNSSSEKITKRSPKKNCFKTINQEDKVDDSNYEKKTQQIFFSKNGFEKALKA